MHKFCAGVEREVRDFCALSHTSVLVFSALNMSSPLPLTSSQNTPLQSGQGSPSHTQVRTLAFGMTPRCGSVTTHCAQKSSNGSMACDKRLMSYVGVPELSPGFEASRLVEAASRP
eukprot:3284072-Prymnesium_polylepis.1